MIIIEAIFFKLVLLATKASVGVFSRLETLSSSYNLQTCVSGSVTVLCLERKSAFISSNSTFLRYTCCSEKVNICAHSFFEQSIFSSSGKKKSKIVSHIIFLENILMPFYQSPFSQSAKKVVSAISAVSLLCFLSLGIQSVGQKWSFGF